MNRNAKPDIAIYKSQAHLRNSNIQSPFKLYGSGATVTSPTRNILKIAQQDFHSNKKLIQSKTTTKLERAIDSLAMQSKMMAASRAGGQSNIKNYTAQQQKWQSPRRNQNPNEGFRSIIQEMHEQNDRTIQQLDEDLKRIKTNLTKIDKESNSQKPSSHCQAMSEEIELLQQQNERLRQKNLQLLNQKKRLTYEVDQYESLIQREKAKQLANLSQKTNNQDNNKFDDILNQRKYKLIIDQKQEECQKLQQQINKLINIKAMLEKRESLHSEQKSKLLQKISELQKERQLSGAGNQQNHKKQLEKKDQYYMKMIQNNEKKKQEISIKMIQKDSIITEQQQYIEEKEKEIQKMQAQILVLSQNEKELKNGRQKTTTQQKKYQKKIESLNSQIQFLSFSYKQTAQQLVQKDEELQKTKKKINKLTQELNHYKNQTEGMFQRLEEERKRSCMLQQIYERLERQSSGVQDKYQSNMNSYKDALAQFQTQLSRAQIQFESLKQDNLDLQHRLHQTIQQNQRLAMEYRKRSEDIINLKRQNFILLGEQKTMKNQLIYSPPKVQRVERISSGDDKIALIQSRQREKDQYLKIKSMESELNNLIKECRSENQKQQVTYQQKEAKLQSTIINLKSKNQSLNTKIEQIQKQLEKVTLDRLKKEETFFQNIRKKQSEWLINQAKTTEITLKYSFLLNENKQLRDRVTQLKSIRQLRVSSISSQKQIQTKKINEIKDESSRFIQKLMKQIKEITQNTRKQNLMKVNESFFGLKDIRTIIDMPQIAEINYVLNNLKESIAFLLKKYLTNTNNTNSSSNFNQRPQIQTKLLEQRTFLKEKDLYRTKILQKTQRNEQKDELNRLLIQKNAELQKKHENQSTIYGVATKQLQQSQEQNQKKQKYITKLKQEIQNLQDEKYKMERKVKYLEQKVKKNNKQQHQFERENHFCSNNSNSQFKQNTEMLSETDFQSQREGRIIQKIRSARSCQRLNILDRRDETCMMINRQSDIKIMQLEVSIQRLERDIQGRDSILQNCKRQKRQLQQKLSKNQQKLNKQKDEYEQLQEQCASIRKKKDYIQLKIKEQEQQFNVVINQIDNIKSKLIEETSQFNLLKQKYQKQIRQLIYEKDQIQKRCKKEIGQKESKIKNQTQINQLKVIQMNSDISKYKDKIHQYQLKFQNLANRIDKLVYQNKKNQEKVKEYEVILQQLRQKLQQEQKQKDKMLGVFSSNTSKLTKILQQKDIEIQQLKFIQESTLINLESVRNQSINRKKQNQSTYSFRYD